MGTKTAAAMSDIVALIQKQMDAAENEMRAIVARAMFRSEGRPLFASFYLQPIPWWKKALWSVRGYCSTLWLALKGHDFEDGGEE